LDKASLVQQLPIVQESAGNQKDSSGPIRDVPIQSGIAFSLEGLFFGSAESELLQYSDSSLAGLISYLKLHPGLQLELSGFTDNLGRPLDNLRLSQARAQAVANVLIRSGISSERITTFGFGEKRPIADNTSEEGRARNRRVEARLKPKPDHGK
jgi:outer membrane protein OmpA-like peptidoglycan-associated protein